MAMNKDQNNSAVYNFDFDPKSIDWDDYFYSVHIPGVLRYMREWLEITSVLYLLCNSNE